MGVERRAATAMTGVATTSSIAVAVAACSVAGELVDGGALMAVCRGRRARDDPFAGVVSISMAVDWMSVCLLGLAARERPPARQQRVNHETTHEARMHEDADQRSTHSTIDALTRSMLLHALHSTSSHPSQQASRFPMIRTSDTRVETARRHRDRCHYDQLTLARLVRDDGDSPRCAGTRVALTLLGGGSLRCGLVCSSPARWSSVARTRSPSPSAPSRGSS